MSSTASNYDLAKLGSGVALSAVAFLLVLVTVTPSLSTPTLAGLFFTLVTVLYGIMMFASSFVEEEQHIWYWGASGWLICMIAYRYTTRPTTPS